jgi:hypothetical protein
MAIVVVILVVVATIWLSGWLTGRYYRPDPDDYTPRVPDRWAATRTKTKVPR